MKAAAIVHRTAFDKRLPWLAGFLVQDVGRWDGQGLIGFISFREGWIDHLYVLPDAHGRGVGTALLTVARSQYDDLSLWTFQANTGARRFCERHGFRAVRMTDGAGNEAREPDVLYHWTRAID